MCKGQILRDIVAKRAYSRVVYVGDSTNDFCPTLVLQTYVTAPTPFINHRPAGSSAYVHCMQGRHLSCTGRAFVGETAQAAQCTGQRGGHYMGLVYRHTRLF